MSYNQGVLNEQDEQNEVWWIAVTLNAFGCFISAYGWMLQKQTHNEQALEETDTENEKEIDFNSEEINNSDINNQSLNFLKRCKWWMGYFTYGLGSAFTAASYGFGPQSLLLPLESLVIVFNAILGAKFLDEHLYKKDYLGIALIIFGLIISVAVAPKGTSEGYTTQELVLLFQQADFLIFLAVYSIMTIIDWICVKYHKFENDTFFMVSFNFIAAYFGSWNVLVVNCIADILGTSFEDIEIAKQNFSHWLTYILCGIWILTIISLEYWRQKALAVYISTYVMSIYRVFIIVGGVLFGALFFNEFQYSTNLEIVLFVFSVCVAMIGVFVVATKVDHNDMLQDRKSVVMRPNMKSAKNGYNPAGTVEEDITDDEIEMENVNGVKTSQNTAEAEIDTLV